MLPNLPLSVCSAQGPLLESPHERAERREEEQVRVKRERRAHRKQQELVSGPCASGVVI